MGARVSPGYTPSKDLLSKVTLEASKGRGFARPGLGPTAAEVYPQPGFGQISGEDFSHPGSGQTREVGAPTPGLGQTNGEGSALTSGRNTNTTNASLTSRQLQADFSRASASGEHTPETHDETKDAEEAHGTTSISPTTA